MWGLISFVPTILRVIVMIYDIIRQLQAKGHSVQECVAAVEDAKKKGDIGKLKIILESLKKENE